MSVSAGVSVGAGGGASANGGASASVNADIKVGGLHEETEIANSDEWTYESLRSHSVCVKCLTCGSIAHSQTEPYISIINMLFAFLCTEFWCCYMCAKRKDWNFYNVRHLCYVCGKYIETYSAC